MTQIPNLFPPFGMTIDECRMTNEGILSILKFSMIERSDFHNSSFDILHSKGGFFGISNLDIICYLFFGACNFLNHESTVLIYPLLFYYYIYET